jgi:membrane-bound serine protease (ClpP class)
MLRRGGLLLAIHPWFVILVISIILLVLLAGPVSISPWLLALTIVILVAAAVFVTNRVVVAHRRQSSTGREELIGMTAVTKTALDPEGTVFVEGELWTARSESGRINPGEEVTIKKVGGLKLWVTRKQ